MVFARVLSGNSLGFLLVILVQVVPLKCLRSSAPFSLSTDEQNVADQCFTTQQCNATAKYRTADGTCNNPEKPWWGAANTPYVRLLKPIYSDTDNNHRVSVVDGSPLPSARLVTSTFLRSNFSLQDKRTRMFMVFAQLISHVDFFSPANGQISPYFSADNNHRVSVVDGSPLPSARLVTSTFLRSNFSLQDKRTRMFMVFAQLISHDVLLNPQAQGSSCCSATGDQVVSTSGVCRPISIPADDVFFSTFGRKCQEYHQSLGTNCSSLPSSPILPKSFTTHYIDASFLYGSSAEEQASLRTGESGKLLTVTDGANNNQYLITKNISSCPFARKNCYGGGDPRVNQHLDLAAMETVFVKFHNAVADKLVAINPSWVANDEILFQESRRIVIGVFQHIIYNEWLPLFIGVDTVKALNLTPATSGFASGYDPKVNPSSLADFAGAAFRTLHSFTPDTITIGPIPSSPLMTIKFSSTFQRPGDFLQEGETFDSVLQDLLTAKQRTLSRFFSTEILDHFIDSRVPLINGSVLFGDDLAAMDVHRGRDYGLRGYNDYRTLCGLPRFEDFKATAAEFGADVAQKLYTAYKSPDDIDYYLGIVLELTGKDTTSVASTLRCIVGEAFQRYKVGDGYFYEWGSRPGSFSSAQLDFIRSVKLSHVICMTANHLESVPSNAFLPAFCVWSNLKGL
ncbi:chorion peroxidase-like [Diaphorina citri]|uniref:Chorion peroxidase-like n=1 Tax=Diaphorina citri TaxID=121845 RepID=A0A3Q0J0D6_DIACI|nr:chorion peroxidase-like [Diaphorina citri]